MKIAIGVCLQSLITDMKGCEMVCCYKIFIENKFYDESGFNANY